MSCQFVIKKKEIISLGVLFDDASTISMISSDSVLKLGLKTRKVSKKAKGFDGSVLARIDKVVDICIQSVYSDDDRVFELKDVAVIEQFPMMTPCHYFNPKLPKAISDRLGDIWFNVPHNCDMLIGVDFWSFAKKNHV